MIKLFSIDPLKIYENNFKNMLYSDFMHLDKIPKGVEEESVRELTQHLQKASSLDIPADATVHQVLLEIELRQL
jgi:hypothetical protein